MHVHQQWNGQRHKEVVYTMENATAMRAKISTWMNFTNTKLNKKKVDAADEVLCDSMHVKFKNGQN